MRNGFKIFIVSILCVMALVISPIFAQTTASSETQFTLSTPAFSSSQAIPNTYSCHDKNISPELTWTGTPPNTKSYMLIVADPDAPGGVHYHWVVYNIPPTVTELTEGMTNVPGIQGRNSSDNAKYEGPCPPKGSTHSYIFTLYALDSLLSVPNDAGPETVIKAAQPHILGTTQITSSFGH